MRHRFNDMKGLLLSGLRDSHKRMTRGHVIKTEQEIKGKGEATSQVKV